ncbi:hypothetical protein KC957_01590 [Candidatus Saccharibacteria bacterium]|nr:hypothetical protein [Candidatus Saccharibacteria bacterium]
MKQVKLLVIASLIAVLGIAPSVYAASTPATPPAGSTAESRLKQRKAEREIKLDEKDTKRLTQTCVAAQSKIRTIYQSATTALTERNKAFYRADAKLWVIIGRLKLADRDTYALEKQRTNFAQQIADFQTTSNNFTQVLDDMQVLNCAADPVGFKALLETAKIYRSQVVSKSNAIRDYAVNDIKKTLTEHTTARQPKTEETQ